jgi:proline dehydrogenase
MRVYVPFGNDWFGYFMRRLAERPQNVALLLKELVKKIFAFRKQKALIN